MDIVYKVFLFLLNDKNTMYTKIAIIFFKKRKIFWFNFKIKFLFVWWEL